MYVTIFAYPFLADNLITGQIEERHKNCMQVYIKLISQEIDKIGFHVGGRTESNGFNYCSLDRFIIQNDEKDIFQCNLAIKNRTIIIYLIRPNHVNISNDIKKIINKYDFISNLDDNAKEKIEKRKRELNQQEERLADYCLGLDAIDEEKKKLNVKINLK